jgi:hypothetical protein
MDMKTLDIKITLKDSGLTADPVRGNLVCRDPAGNEHVFGIDINDEQHAVAWLLRECAVVSGSIIRKYKNKAEDNKKIKGKVKPKKGGK